MFHLVTPDGNWRKRPKLELIVGEIEKNVKHLFFRTRICLLLLSIVLNDILRKSYEKRLFNETKVIFLWKLVWTDALSSRRHIIITFISVIVRSHVNHVQVSMGNLSSYIWSWFRKCFGISIKSPFIWWPTIFSLPLASKKTTLWRLHSHLHAKYTNKLTTCVFTKTHEIRKPSKNKQYNHIKSNQRRKMSYFIQSAFHFIAIITVPSDRYRNAKCHAWEPPLSLHFHIYHEKFVSICKKKVFNSIHRTFTTKSESFSVTVK